MQILFNSEFYTRGIVIISIVFLTLLISASINAQQPELYIPVNIQNAFTNQTRSADGNPGKNYWQNFANYNIDIELNPYTGLLKGKEEIEYFNNSPDTLKELYIHLFMNIYKKGNPREYVVKPSDENEGVIIESLSVKGKKVEESKMEYIHNDFILHLDEPLLSKEKTHLSISWNYKINKESHFRTGQVDSTSWFVAYFFPRIAVYDDIDGWNNFKYSGSAEFYNDFGDFDVSITVPQNYVVWATGMLQNPEEVLTEKYSNRLKTALQSDNIVNIVDSTDIKTNQITQPNQKNTWQFKADYINDFAFAVSDHYLWDASSLIVDKQSNRRVLIDAAYNENSMDFYKVAKIARQSIDYMSNEIPGVPFPYPNLTVFNGLDEMEYPMMVNDFSTDDSLYLVKLTSHEIFHSYFPFFMGTNETKYAWMDEGFASYGDYLIVSELISPEVANYYYLELYRSNVGDETDVPIITNSKHLTRPMYHFNAYAKSASFLYILHDLLGDDLFKSCLQEFMIRWNGKHPIPYDFFNTLNDVSGHNLNWLIKPWFFEFGYVDLGIKDASNNSCTIEKIGLYPAPIHLEIVFDDGSKKVIKKNAEVWKDGKQEINIHLHFTKNIKIIEVLNRLVPDADPSNNIYIIK